MFGPLCGDTRGWDLVYLYISLQSTLGPKPDKCLIQTRWSLHIATFDVLREIKQQLFRTRTVEMGQR